MNDENTTNYAICLVCKSAFPKMRGYYNHIKNTEVCSVMCSSYIDNIANSGKLNEQTEQELKEVQLL